MRFIDTGYQDGVKENYFFSILTGNCKRIYGIKKANTGAGFFILVDCYLEIITHTHCS